MERSGKVAGASRRGGLATQAPGSVRAKADRVSNSTERFTVAFFYRVVGDVKFISHHDTMRMFRRAAARARLPVRFTEGFNPHPRISLPLPRPVGMASDAELVIMEMSQAVDAEEALHGLAAQAPRGIEMTRACSLPAGRPLQPESACYRLDTGPPTPALLESVEQLIQSDVVPIRRFDHKGRAPRTINVKEYLLDIQWVGQTLEFWLRVTDRGTVRPSEVAAALGFDAKTINHRIRRMEVQWR